MGILFSSITRLTCPVLALLATGLLAGGAGCVADGKSRPMGERVTTIDKEKSEPAFYLSKPTVASVQATDFDALWASIHRVTWNAGYKPDRQDFRLGLYTTKPLVSQQLFEFWRSDVGGFNGLVQSSLGTLRRTVRWDVTRDEEGAFHASPKVLIERYTVIEHRISSEAQYTEIFALTREETRNQRLQALDPAAVLTDPIPTAYWYAIGRDEGMEKKLAEKVSDRLK